MQGTDLDSVRRGRLGAFARGHAIEGLALAAVLSPFVVALVSLVGHLGDAARPWGDQALIETSVRAVGSRSVLLGPFSQWGWRHPGPLYFYLLAVPYRVLGSSYAALLVGPVLIGAVASAGIVLVAARRGGRALAVWSALVVLVFLGAAGALVVDVWNPWVTMLPFALAVMLAWSLACGDLWALPGFVVVATFVVQTHVGYLPVLGVIGAVSFGVAVADARRDRPGSDERGQRWRALRRLSLLSIGLLGLLWLPALVDQVVNDPGNARTLAAFFRSHGGDHTLGDGLRTTTRYLGAVPARLLDGAGIFDSGRRDVASWPTIVTVAGLVGAVGVAWWRRARPLVMLVVLVALTCGLTVVSVSRMVGPIHEYLVDWIAAIGIPLWIAVGAAGSAMISSDWQARIPTTLRRGIAAGGLVVLVVLMLDAVGPFEIGDPEPSTVTATALTDAVRAELPRRDEVPVVVRVRDDPGLTPWAAGILDGLDADGRDVRVERAPLTEVSMWPWELTTRRRGVIFVTIRPVRAGRTSTVRVGDIAVDVTRSAR